MANPNAPIPIIKNEELILLRAEANIGTGALDAAIADLNLVRQSSGGLPPTTLTTSSPHADFVAELLYNRRYSLFFEYGHRWVDMRRYGRLAQLEKMAATHRIYPLVPLTLAECLPRNNTPKGCVQVSGF